MSSPLFKRPGKALADSHCLDLHDCGTYRAKITLTLGDKLTGKRFTQPLNTRDRAEAEARCKVLLGMLSRLGLLAGAEVESGDN